MNIFHLNGLSQDINFSFNSNNFQVGQTKKIVIYYSFSGPGRLLHPESEKTLDSIFNFLKQNPKIIIEIGAYTDYRGKDETNKRLSQYRAESVRDYLIFKGINTLKVIAKGYGEESPFVVDLISNKLFPKFPIGQVLDKVFIEGLSDLADQENAHMLNRRTILKILKISK
jgi:outer membrane protein OmpA-like peptidoglycan-associated protein